MKAILRSFLILVCLMFISVEAQLLKVDTVDCSKRGELDSFVSWSSLINMQKLIKAWSTGPYPKMAKIGEMYVDSIACVVELFTKIVNQDSLTDSRVQINCGELGTRKYTICYLTADDLIDLITNWWTLEETRKILKLADQAACLTEIKKLNTSESKLDMFFLLWIIEHRPPPAVKDRLIKWKNESSKKNGMNIFLNINKGG